VKTLFFAEAEVHGSYDEAEVEHGSRVHVRCWMHCGFMETV